jgi:hypothetical protein
VRDILTRLLSHCARAAPYVGGAAGGRAGRAGRSGEGWSRVDDVEDTSRLFATAWEARAAAAMLAWFVHTEGRGGGVEGDGGGGDEGGGGGGSSRLVSSASSSSSSSSSSPLSSSVSESALDDVLRVLGVTEDGGGDPAAALPVRAMMSLRREATGPGRGLHLDPSLRRNLLLAADE